MVAVAFTLLQQPPMPTPGHPVPLPTEFVENRFALVPVAKNGRRIRFLTDSAGSLNISEDVVDALKLPKSPFPREVEGRKVRVAPFPAFKPEASIPPSLGPKLMVFQRKMYDQEMPGFDGQLGQQWFAGRVWTFDYPGKMLYWRAPGDLPKHDAMHEIRLHFRTDSKGRRETNFARLDVVIDGETIPFTLDTGATNVLSSEALKEIGDNRPADRETSFLGESVYKKWHAKHPDWRVVTAKTETGRVMIEAPKVTIGGYTVGPVWFSVQRDSAFHEYMAQWTDIPTEGSLGGSCFKYFRMTVDWPNAVAVFERPDSLSSGG